VTVTDEAGAADEAGRDVEVLRPEGCGADQDADGDGYGGAGCLGQDCLDDDPEVWPGAPEVCDGKDNDCSLVADDPA